MDASRTRRNAYLAWLVVCFVWGTTYLGIRIALDTIPPALVGGIRYTIAGAVMLAALRVRGERLPLPASWPIHFALGALMLGVGNGFVVLAEQWVPSGIAAVIIATAPFWMSGIEAVSGGERFRARTLLGLCIGFGGIVLLVWPALTTGGERGQLFLWGIAALQVACIGWSIGSTLSKRYATGENALVASAMQMLFGGLAMLAIGTVDGEWDRLTFTTRTAAAELYLVVAGSIVGYSAYVYALKYLPVSTVSLYAYVNPLIAVLLGTVLLDEPFTTRVALASVLVILGVATVRIQNSSGTSRGKGGGTTQPLPRIVVKQLVGR